MPSDREGILQGRQSGSAAKLSGLFDEEMLKPVLDDNGQRKMEKVPQYELVTSHAARRTFATFLVSKGVATRTVMSMTGHKVESEFNKYVNLNAVETALKVKELAGGRSQGKGSCVLCLFAFV